MLVQKLFPSLRQTNSLFVFLNTKHIISIELCEFISSCYASPRNIFILSKMSLKIELQSMNDSHRELLAPPKPGQLKFLQEYWPFLVLFCIKHLNNQIFSESLHLESNAYEAFGLFPRKTGHSARMSVCFPDDAFRQLKAAVVSYWPAGLAPTSPTGSNPQRGTQLNVTRVSKGVRELTSHLIVSNAAHYVV